MKTLICDKCGHVYNPAGEDENPVFSFELKVKDNQTSTMYFEMCKQCYTNVVLFHLNRRSKYPKCRTNVAQCCIFVFALSSGRFTVIHYKPK
jgi:hypothetical protein